MQRKWIILLTIVIAAFVLIYAFLFMLFLFPLSTSTFMPGQGKIALIRIDGPISAEGGGDGLLAGGGTSSESVMKQLGKADKDSSVKAILLRINSPGGTAAASEEIFIEVKRTKKPVVVSIADIGASGAYLISCGSDKIVANSASSVGSIGTILAIPNFKKLYEKLGIEYVIITEGKYKSLGHPARTLTKKEKDILQEQSEIIYRQFVINVSKSRKIPREKVKDMANGLTFPGEQALQMGLIDEIGNYRDAVDQCAKMGKIKGEPVIVEYEAQGLPKWLSQVIQGKGTWLLRILVPRYLQSSPVTNL